MAYGMQQLRKAGKALLDADERYANKVGESINPKTQPIAELTRAVPIRHMLEPSNATTRAEKVIDAAMVGGITTANVAARYALPAGGITLAGKGLYDLTMKLAYGGPADQQEKGQLSLR